MWFGNFCRAAFCPVIALDGNKIKVLAGFAGNNKLVVCFSA